MCVYETGLLLLFAYVALLLLPLSFFLGVGAPSLSLGGLRLHYLSWLNEAHGSLLLRRPVSTRRACCLRISAASVELLPRFGVSSLSLGGLKNKIPISISGMGSESGGG